MKKWHCKIVRDDKPNEPGRWVEHFSDDPPNFDEVIREGTHIVQVQEGRIGPPDQPFYMHSSFRS